MKGASAAARFNRAEAKAALERGPWRILNTLDGVVAVGRLDDDGRVVFTAVLGDGRTLFGLGLCLAVNDLFDGAGGMLRSPFPRHLVSLGQVVCVFLPACHSERSVPWSSAQDVARKD